MAIAKHGPVELRRCHFIAISLFLVVTLVITVYYSCNKLAINVSTVDNHVDKKHDTLSIINHINYEHCHSNNIVMSRGDDYGHDPGQDKRPYSISPQTFQALELSHDTICDSVNNTMHAIAAGERHWINVTHENLSSMEKEKMPSYFVPATCNLPAFTASQLCDIMNQYSYVITIGDSLTRHLRQAFFMAMLDNHIDGGMVIPDGSVSQDQFYSCRCDGQFSENLSCRSLGGIFGNLVNPREYHVCSHLPIDTDRFQFSVGWNDAVFDALCKQGDIATNNNTFRGILLVLQGGIHYGGSNPVEYVNKSLAPFFQQPGFQTCSQIEGAVNVIWTTFNSQSRTLDDKYPHQSREKANDFNDYVISYLQQQPFSVTLLDQHKLTMDAQTSDGQHYLSDVNLLKVYFILHLASRMKQEQGQG